MSHLNINNGRQVIVDSYSLSNYAFYTPFNMRTNNYRKCLRVLVKGMTHMAHNAQLSRFVYQMQHAIFQKMHVKTYTLPHICTYVQVKKCVFAKEEVYTNL